MHEEEPRRPARRPSGATGYFRGPSGTEPVTARSALGLRLVLSLVFAPIFAAGAAFLAFWSATAHRGSAPPADSLAFIAGLCALLALIAIVDVLVVLRRRRQERDYEQSADRRS
ncbi:DUF6343 family protein [Streptomyces sp. TP-A0874]|uniref:DUF6343 family protein n=1 Tax=Streptomyces sp. TP-A0874 TaxID=549819 RepID=UPI00085297B8|nr:DUF6343 family protein [Streptomyces sp. TP-A0874]